MSRKSNTQVTHCSFPPPISTTKFYTCYKKEVCCQQGCCINGPYHIYQVWYYWFLFLIIFGVISGGSWLCKKPRPVTCRTVSRNTLSSRNSCSCSHSGCNRRRCASYFNNTTCENGLENTTDFEDNIILDRLFVSFRNRNSLGDPPSYTSILSSDYNKAGSKFCPLYSYYGPPPTYSSMFILSNPNENIPTFTPAPSVEIQIHAEDQGNQTDGITAPSNVPANADNANERHESISENVDRNPPENIEIEKSS